MKTMTSLRYQLIAACSGLVLMILYPIFWAWIGHAQPPLSLSLGAEQVSAILLRDRGEIVFGMVIATIIGGLWIPWTAQLTLVLWRIEGKAPLLSITQLIGGILTAWALISCPPLWALAAFRPDAGPDVIRAVNDIAFFIFNLTAVVSTMQAVPAGLIGLTDRSDEPVFPRWVCYLAIVAGLSFLGVTPMPFFQSGPMALNGAFVGWIPGTMFFLWTGTMGYYLLRDARRKIAAVRADSTQESPSVQTS
jgi:hypothetical protein